jgi:hypothetical protein
LTKHRRMAKITSTQGLFAGAEARTGRGSALHIVTLAGSHRKGQSGLARNMADVAACMRAGVVGAALLGLQAPAHAELLVDGSREQVVVKVDQRPLSDVIEALANRFNVTLRSSVALDAVVNGRYAGSLTSVLARLLRSYDFVLAVGRNRDADPISIIVVGQSGDAPTTSALARLQAPRAPAPRGGEQGL